MERFFHRQSDLIRSEDNISKALATFPSDQLPKLNTSVDVVQWLLKRISVSYFMWKDPVVAGSYVGRLYLHIDLKHDMVCKVQGVMQEPVMELHYLSCEGEWGGSRRRPFHRGT